MKEATLLYTLTTSEINNAKDPLKYFNLLNKRYCILRSLLQTLLRCFNVVNLWKCWQIFQELNSKLKTVSKCRKRKKRGRCVEIRYFHVVVVQQRQRNVQKSVMQSCCFSYLNLMLFCRSRCRRRRRCLSFLLNVYEIRCFIVLQVCYVLYINKKK